MSQTKRWTSREYEDLFYLATSGMRVYPTDFNGGDEEVLRSLLTEYSGVQLTDENRREIMEYALAVDCHYFRPIRTWESGLRVYIGYFDKAFFAMNYLASKDYAHQIRWRKNFNRRRHLQLAPRSHGKSRIYSFELPIWNICYLDNIRLLHVTNVDRQAQKYLVSIRTQFEVNDALRGDFGDLTKGLDEQGLEYSLSGTWSKEMFYVRRTNLSLKDPTMQAIGTGQAITGSRLSREAPW